jgi:uncharacterized protein YcbK (DUF882 family)
MQLSRNFDSNEFVSEGLPSLGLQKRLKKLCEFLELFREQIGGVPITVTSGYRSKQDNERVGGSPTSSHLTGEACDVQVETFTSETLALHAELAFLRAGRKWDQIIVYTTHLHIGIGGRERQQVFVNHQ